jgi:hypothetical protein
MVFVAPEDILSEFKFPANLGEKQMFVTVPNAITEDALASDRVRNVGSIEQLYNRNVY